LLKAAPLVSGLTTERAATLADFDALVGHLPTLASLGAKERAAFIAHAEVTQAAASSTILNVGDESNDAYFILSGRAVAGVETEPGSYRSLSTLQAGDFFGEIAALTGSKRTANVVADENTTLLRIPAENLRNLMIDPQISHLVLTKMSERLSRTHTSDLPRLAGLDQESLRDLRTAQTEI
jgi:CRP-like cAMP-binding protein